MIWGPWPSFQAVPAGLMEKPAAAAIYARDMIPPPPANVPDAQASIDDEEGMREEESDKSQEEAGVGSGGKRVKCQSPRSSLHRCRPVASHACGQRFRAMMTARSCKNQ